jgi:Tfp pilus assembly protein PilF
VSQKAVLKQASLRGRRLPVWQGVGIILLALLVYLPALHGGFVWDDDSWTTGITHLLRDGAGLRLIWFQPTALQQYYPLTGTTFWLDYQCWGFWTTPYHVENVLLHALAALLFWRLLVRLQVPGAWLAGALFALHPVMVESVAWITERKNVLSLVFYLGALLAYLRYAERATGDQPSPSFGTAGKGQVTRPDFTRSPVTWHVALFYGLAFILFLGALLAKTTTFSLPAVILLIGWWKRGQLRWRTEVLPTLPFFALALGFCAVTAWLEKYHVGAQGPDFALTFPQRCLIAGRAFWFYLGHLFWPTKLCFIYPRWQPNPGVWWQWLYPVTALGALLTLWLARRRIGRGPVTALLFFVGTLFPVLGFLNAFGMLYSFVWDHWVYLSAPGIIALAAALVMQAARKQPAAVYGLMAVGLAVLGVLTWRQAGMYRNVETLWRTTLARNPDCWMARNNLGIVLADKGRLDEAIENYRQGIQINPKNFKAFNNLGLALVAKGRLDEAVESYREAIRSNPNYPEALNNLGIALVEKGRPEEAIRHFYQALQIKPDFAEALNNLGIALANKGQFEEAIKDYHQAIQINPNYSEALNNLGIALAGKGRFDEAIENYRQAIQINPHYFEALNNLGLALVARGRPDEAMESYREAIRSNPDYAEALNNLGNVLAGRGRLDEAIENYRKAIQANPNDFKALNNLGLALVAKGRLDEAIENYRRALQVNPNYSEALNNLGIALADQGRLEDGMESFRQAVRINPDNFKALNNLGLALAAQGRLDEAIENYRRAVRSNPNYFEALDNLGSALTAGGQLDEAIKSYRQAIQINSHRPEIFFHLGMALGQAGRNGEAADQYREALRLNPNLMWALNNLAWLLATSPDDGLRNGVEAVRLAERACDLNHYREPLSLGTLAAAYAEAGRFPEAVATAEKAEQLATRAGLKAVAEKNRQLVELYRAGKPYRELPSSTP